VSPHLYVAQYRPYRRGLSQSTGYGLARPTGERAVGFLRVELRLSLLESPAATLLRSPWSYAPQNALVAEVCVVRILLLCAP
jgi:hypothetical protein